jgi:hypothetical protein
MKLNFLLTQTELFAHFVGGRAPLPSSAAAAAAASAAEPADTGTAAAPTVGRAAG